MSAAGKGELSKTQSRSRLRLGDMKTLNSPDGNWLRRRNSIPRRIPASRSFAPISLLPFGMERHYPERRVNNHQILNILMKFRWTSQLDPVRYRALVKVHK